MDQQWSGAKSNRHNHTGESAKWGQNKPSYRGQLNLSQSDVPAALGWWGGTNYALSGADFSAVLQSWEDRFGTVLVSIGFDTMTVQVGRRPESEQQLDALLREHYAFCPDNIDQGMKPDAFRLGLAEWGYWNFWWD